MNAPQRFSTLLSECPLIAILRGVKPDEVEEVGEALFEAGIRIIEVPLNSPQPLESIARLSVRLGDRALIGAGTVMHVNDVAGVLAAGGELIVSPSCDVDVIDATVAAGLASSPGFFTPTEAFRAIDAGAHALKLFPAEAATPAVIRAMRAVLPTDVPIVVVGGVTPAAIAAWREAGANGFGLGSSLYRAGQSREETLLKASAFVASLGG